LKAGDWQSAAVGSRWSVRTQPGRVLVLGYWQTVPRPWGGNWGCTTLTYLLACNERCLARAAWHQLSATGLALVAAAAASIGRHLRFEDTHRARSAT